MGDDDARHGGMERAVLAPLAHVEDDMLPSSEDLSQSSKSRSSFLDTVSESLFGEDVVAPLRGTCGGAGGGFSGTDRQGTRRLLLPIQEPSDGEPQVLERQMTTGSLGSARNAQLEDEDSFGSLMSVKFEDASGRDKDRSLRTCCSSSDTTSTERHTHPQSNCTSCDLSPRGDHGLRSMSSSRHELGCKTAGERWRRDKGMLDLSEFERVIEPAQTDGLLSRPVSLASPETLTPTPTSLQEHQDQDSSAFCSSSHREPELRSLEIQGLSDPAPGKAAQEEEDHDVFDCPVVTPREGLIGAVGGGSHACGCGVGGPEDNHARGPTCPTGDNHQIYVEEQFPSGNLLAEGLHDGVAYVECDSAPHLLHLNLATGEVELHIHVTDPEKVCPDELNSKCPEEQAVATTSSSHNEEEGRNAARKPISFSSGIGVPSMYHALVVIFLEFFAWGLLATPMIAVLDKTFPDHTFLMNGLIMGIKGLLSFLSAPLIGALSDVWGRKFFLFITVFFTCLPIPFMKINTWWYFALISISGVFAVTFSIVFAYVADVTDEAERSSAYGLVSATFAASLVTSPALGAYLGKVHSDDLVVGLATAIAVLDVFFILVAVPESLPEKLRLSSSWSAHISWEQADPFSALWKVSKDRNILLISTTVFLSYLPEAGQYSCFFVYLKLVMNFSDEEVATFIAVVGILSVVAQTAVLGLLMRTLSNKRVIIVGLAFELLQLMWYGFGSQTWMMWAAGMLAAISSITYPALSAFVSTHADADKQGVVQGIITGMRSLCSGLGPAVYGFIFYLFHVDLNSDSTRKDQSTGHGTNSSQMLHPSVVSNRVPGPPFVFGAFLVILAVLVAAFIPEGNLSGSDKTRKSKGSSIDLYDRGHKKNASRDASSLPLMDETGIL